MLKDIIPTELFNCLVSCSTSGKIMEIRIRQNKPICFMEQGSFKVLKNVNGKELYADKKLIDYIVMRATDSSLYCYNNQLKQFYLSVGGGIRIGVCGEVVSEGEKVVSLKNITSLTIRVPNEIIGCSNNIMSYVLCEDKIKNTLIVSPPGMGKTTLLRDLARNICSGNKVINGLVVDERQEIAGLCGTNNSLDIGAFSDCITRSTKVDGIMEGIRSMRPDVIFTDEIGCISDADAVLYAMTCGVGVVATVHGEGVSSLTSKHFLKNLLASKMIENYVFLSDRNGVGTIDALYNKYLKPVWGNEV